MKGRFLYALGMVSVALGLSASIVVAEEASKMGVDVREDAASVTGYTVDFSYKDEKVTNVTLMGGFEFYSVGDLNVYANGFILPANDNQKNHLVAPNDWTPNSQLRHINDVGYSIELNNEDNGVWKTSLDLPGGWYLYQYNVSYDNGETYTAIADPGNQPYVNKLLDAEQTRSQFYVPYNENQGEEEYYDWTWSTPVNEESQKGGLCSFSYEGLDGEQVAEIYLPANYDPDREEAYKVLYLSHGGGGNEGDWFYQGNAGNILDRMIAEKKAEPFIIVCMNNASYVSSFQTNPEDRSYSSNDEYFLYCYKNIHDYLIPYVEANYNVSKDTMGRAFAGLSNGAKLTTEIFINDPDEFGYYGFFSGSAVWAWPETEDYSEYMNANIYLAAGYADQLMMQNTYHTNGDKTLIGFKEALDNSGIIYNSGNSYITVEGAHDWFTWMQIFKDYVGTTLWK